MAKIVYTPGPEVWAVKKGFLKKRYLVSPDDLVRQYSQKRPKYRTLRAAKNWANTMTDGPNNIYVVLDLWPDA